MHSDDFSLCVSQRTRVLVMEKIRPDRSELGRKINRQPPNGVLGNQPRSQIGPAAVPLAPGLFATKKKTYSFS